MTSPQRARNNVEAKKKTRFLQNTFCEEQLINDVTIDNICTVNILLYASAKHINFLAYILTTCDHMEIPKQSFFVEPEEEIHLYINKGKEFWEINRDERCLIVEKCFCAQHNLRYMYIAILFY